MRSTLDRLKQEEAQRAKDRKRAEEERHRQSVMERERRDRERERQRWADIEKEKREREERTYQLQHRISSAPRINIPVKSTPLLYDPRNSRVTFSEPVSKYRGGFININVDTMAEQTKAAPSLSTAQLSASSRSTAASNVMTVSFSSKTASICWSNIWCCLGRVGECSNQIGWTDL